MISKTIQFHLFNFNFKLIIFDESVEKIHFYIDEEWIYKGKLNYNTKNNTYHFTRNNIVKEIFCEKEDLIYKEIDKKLQFYFNSDTFGLFDSFLEIFQDEEFSTKLVKIITKELIKIDDCCWDNLRCAEIGNNEQEKEYDKKQQKGCCGFYDEIFEIDGRKIKIGFNYGH